MSLKDHLPKGIRDAVFEEEEKTEEQQPKPVPLPVAASYVNAPSAPPTPAAIATGDDKYYERLVAKTNPELMPNVGKILTLAKPLEAVIPDQTLRLRAALAQATAQGVNLQSALQEMDNVIQALETERSNFLKWAEDGSANIEKKKQQLHDLSVDIAESSAHLDSAKAGFASAATRRVNELSTLKAQLATIH